MAQVAAAAEWRRHFMLPVAGAFGYATAVLHTYGLGPYIQPVSEDFGWSRTQTTAGLTIALLIQAILAIPMGTLIDRFGARRFGLAGIVLMTGSFALLGTATGEPANWYMLWVFLAVISMPSQSMVWTSAVVACFDRSRGLALAITMCGASLATSIFPVLATWLIGMHGWRSAMAWQGTLWAAVAFPMIFFFLRGRQDQSSRSVNHQASEDMGSALLDALRSSIYLRLIAATAFLGLSITSLVIHFVPILVSRGANAMEAAGIASLIGIAAIVGRLTTGYLLDRLRASLVGAIAFLLPALSCVLLIWGDGFFLQAVAAIFVGLTLGAEVDVLAYLLTRYFPLTQFGALLGGQLMAVATGTAVGPLVAAKIFDSTGSYSLFLMFVIVAMILSSLSLISLPNPKQLIK